MVPKEPASGFVEALLRVSDVAERAARRGPRVVGAEPLFLEAFRLQRDVSFDFRGEVGGLPLASKHGYVSTGPRMRPIAAASRLHLSVSFTSCLRPAGVSE